MADGGNPFSSFPCPKCGATITKTFSTKSRDGEYRRSRKCSKCGGTFFTYEVHGSEMRVLRGMRSLYGGKPQEEPSGS